MRSAKSFEQSFYSSDDLKSRATNTKRLLGGLRNLKNGILDFDAKDSKQLSDAIALVTKVSEVYADASRLKKKVEKADALVRENIAKLVKASAFAKLTSVADKVAFISHIRKHELESADMNAWSARYCMSNTYQAALDAICFDIAAIAKSKSKMHQEVLDEAIAKFQEGLPERHKRYAGLVERLEKLLADDPKTA